LKKEMLFILFFSVPVILFSEKLIVKDDAENWTIGISDLSTEASDTDGFLGKTVSAYLFNKLSVCKNHLLSDTEIINLKKRILRQRRSEEDKNLLLKQVEYDEKFFTDNKNRKDLKKNIRDVRKLIKKINKYDSEKINIKKNKDIYFLSSAENEKLGSVIKTDINSLASEVGFDYLIYGKVSIFDDVVFIDISLYSRDEEKDLSTISRAFEIKTFYDELDEALKQFFTIILGRSWSAISVDCSEDADIYIDNEYAGSRTLSGKILNPGNHIVKISGTGIEEKVYSVFLEENQFYTLLADSGYEEETLVAVNTFPDEADIYYDSLWMGKSPVIVNSNKGEIFIRKDGYREKRVLIEDLDDNIIDFNLSPELFTREDYLLNKRDDFYKNLSWFVLSAPIPFFIFTALNDYNSSYISAVSSGTNMSEIDRLEKIRNYCYYGYYGSLFISISLFVNMIFHLNDYIEAGDILEK
jgi:hypothetical protein